MVRFRKGNFLAAALSIIVSANLDAVVVPQITPTTPEYYLKTEVPTGG